MATVIDGKQVAAEIRQELTAEVAALKEQGINPGLAVVLVGADPASLAYARFLEKVSTGVGVMFKLSQLPETTAEDELIGLIQRLNHDSLIHGILQLMPLPGQISKRRVMESLSPLKDVDGLHPYNRGHLLSGAKCLYPATPASCLEIITRRGISLAGKHAVIVGRGETVGKPLVFMALAQNATVTVCHTKTENLADHTRQADILFSAVGRPDLIKADMVKPGAVVVDAGISEVNGAICGDVDFAGVSKVAGAITPVPGGVGSLTTALILKNLLKAIDLQG